MLMFTQISQSIWMKFGLLPRPVGLLKLRLNFVCMTNIKGRERYFGDTTKSMLEIGLCSDVYTPIFLKLPTMADMIKIYTLIPL